MWMQARLYVPIWFVLVTSLPGSVHASTQSEVEFAQAYHHYSEGDHSRAEARFQSALTDTALVLADYALHYLGRIAIETERYQHAQGYYSRLRRLFPQSIWGTEASFAFVEIDLARRRYQAAIRRAIGLKKAARGRHDRARAAYYLGQAYAAIHNNREAYSFHQEARRRAPRSRWASHAKDKILELRRKHPGTLGLRSGSAMLREAKQLRRERDYTGAADLYRRILRETNFRRLSLEGLIDVYRKLRLRNEEEQILRRYVQHYPQRDRAGTALTRIATIQWNRNENTEALKTLRQFRRQNPSHIRRRYAAYVIGRIHESIGDSNEAIRTFRQLLAKKHRFSPYRNKAAWRLAWIYYGKSEFHHAETIFQDIARRPGNFGLAAAFWEARIAERRKSPFITERLYRRLIKKDPKSYYALLASRRLKGLGAAPPYSPPPTHREQIAVPLHLSLRASLHLTRARALAQLDLNQLAHLELEQVRRHANHTPDLKLLLMREYARAHSHHRSLSLALQLPPSTETQRLRYPLAFWDAVQRHAADNSLDPYLVLSLIRQESLFRTGAVSPANALGLMQLLHDTARNEASRMGLPEPNASDLFDPNLNIRLGAHHLKGLLEHYSHSQPKALAAYNAGKEAVERWTREFGSPDDIEFIERIPYRETRQYVKAVLRNYHTYLTLYGKLPTEEP